MTTALTIEEIKDIRDAAIAVHGVSAYCSSACQDSAKLSNGRAKRRVR